MADGTERDTVAAPRRVTDEPDWSYLLREVYEMYRASGAGGSEKIRSHQRAVREAVSRTLAENPPLLGRERETKPVLAHLKRALDRGRLTTTASVIRAIESIDDQLSWLWGYDRVPKGLRERFAWSEFAGPFGPVETDRVILGLVLFAPGCIYPAHHHDGITESYYVLSGTCSENDEGVYAPGSMIFNPPGRRHRITVGDREPTLLLYAWTGPAETLKGQKLSFSKNGSKG